MTTIEISSTHDVQREHETALKIEDAFYPFAKIQLPEQIEEDAISKVDELNFYDDVKEMKPVAEFPFTIKGVRGELGLVGVSLADVDGIHRYELPLGKVSETVSFLPPIEQYCMPEETQQAVPLSLIVKFHVTTPDELRTISTLTLRLKIGENAYDTSFYGGDYESEEEAISELDESGGELIAIDTTFKKISDQHSSPHVTILLPYDTTKLGTIEAHFKENLDPIFPKKPEPEEMVIYPLPEEQLPL